MKKPGTYLLRYGELALKGRNRNRFVDDLVQIIRPRIKPLGGSVEKKHKRLLVHCDAEPEQVRQALSTVFGLTSISPIWKTSHDLNAIKELCWDLVKEHAGTDQTFAVRARRSNKRYPITSPDLQKEIANNLLERGLNLKVNLKNPDVYVGVNIDFTDSWVFTEFWPAGGGLPVARTPLHGLLLSGGIDSPVAGNLIQKRGGSLEAVYFHTPPFTVEAAREKVMDLSEVLARYQNGLKLHVVNFTEMMKTIRSECHEAYTVVLSRRMMMRAASMIMEQIGGKSLVTGESLGQVASQTIENIAAVNDGVPYPILRPLIGMDKQEIIAHAIKIGTYDISIRPAQDCCSLFSPKDPITRARMDTEALLHEAMELTEVISF